MDRIPPETVARELGAYQRLQVLIGRTAVTIVTIDGRVQVHIGYLGNIDGEGTDLAAAIKDVYQKVFPEPSLK